MSEAIKQEITLACYAVLAAINAVQVAISIPAWVHVIIVVVSAAVAAIVNRLGVMPVDKAEALIHAAQHPPIEPGPAHSISAR